MIGVAIVSYNSAGVLGRCLASCGGFRVVVVDNCSSDSSVAVARSHSGVSVIVNERNRGFAAAANQAVRHLGTEHILLLNPDAAIEEGVDCLEAALRTEGVGAAGGVLVGNDGRPQEGFYLRGLPTAATLSFEVLGWNRIWPGNPVNRRYRGGSDQPAGAFLAFRRAAWDAIGGFDERFYPIWFEDVDFCKRLKDKGYRISFVSAARARHDGGQSAAMLEWGERQTIWYVSLLRYASKHYSAASRRVVSAAVILGCAMRCLGCLARHPSRHPVRVYSRVVWAACRTLLQGSPDADGVKSNPVSSQHYRV